MATTPNGIMALPENDEMGAPQLSLNESYDAMRQGLKNARPDAATDLDSTMAEILPQLEGMPDDVIDKLLQTVQYLKDNPDQYAEIVAKLIGMGVVKEGDFPPEYDPEFLATMGVVLLETQRSRSEAPAQPTGFAKGGIADAARIMASKGRGRDSMLAHITPNEARLLRSRGGMGTRNPSTGLPEYGFLDDLWGGIKGAVGGVFDAVKGALKSPIGRVLGTIALGAFLGPGAFGITGMGLGAAAAPLASGIISGFSGGSAMDMLTSAATSYLGSSASPLSEYVGKMTSGLNLGATASQALTSGLVGTGVGLLTGKSLEDSVASGLQGAAMNAAMDQLNAGKAPVSDADRAPVENKTATPNPNYSPVPAPYSGTTFLGEVNPYEASPTGVNPSKAEVKPITSIPPAPIPAAATAAPAAASAGYNPPSLMDSMGKMFKSGKFMEGATETFFPSGPTDDDVFKSSQFKAARDAGLSADKAFEKVKESMSPNMFRQYGPLVAAGLGATAAFGGFEPQKLEKSAQYNSLTGGPGSAKDLRSKNPRKYDLQGIPGVMYSPEGAIIGYRSPSGVESLYAKGGAVKSARKTKASTTEYPGGEMRIPEWDTWNDQFNRLPEEDFSKIPYFPNPTPYNNTSNYGNLMNPTKYVRPPAKALPPRPVAAEYGYKPTRPPVTRPEPLRPPVNQNGDTRARKADTPGMVQIGTTSGGKPMYGPAETNPYQGSAAGSVAPPAALPVDSPPQTGPTAASRGETIIDAAATPPPAVQKLPAAATATPPKMVQTNTGPNGRPIFGPAAAPAAPAAPASGGIMSLNNAGAPPNEGREGPYGASERDTFGSGGGAGYDGGGGGGFGGMAKGGYINKRAPYKPRGDVANGPVWGPGGMVYPSRSVALAMGVPADKIFKTAFEAYQGKANVAPTPVPPTPVPPIPVPPTPVPPPVIIDGGGGNDGGPGGNDGGRGGGSERVGGPPNYDYGGSSYGAAGSRNTDIGFLSSLLGNKGQMPAPIEDKSTFQQSALDERTAQQGKATDIQDSSRDDTSGPMRGKSGDVDTDDGPAQAAPVGPAGGIASLGGGSIDAVKNAIAQNISDAKMEAAAIAAVDAARFGTNQATPASVQAAQNAIHAAGIAERQAAQERAKQAQAAQQAAVDAAAFAGAQQAQEAQAQANREASTSTAPAPAPAPAPSAPAPDYGPSGSADFGSFSGGFDSSGTPSGGDYAHGGYIGSYAQGGMGASGIASLLQGGYPRKIGEIAGPGTGTSDDIPAMLSDGEFVMTAKAVRGAGKGSRRDGAKRMYALMHQLERNAARG